MFTLNVHLEYDENAEHTIYSVELPDNTPQSLCILIGKGLLFGWDLSTRDNWSMWHHDRCFFACGAHETFLEKDLLEQNVPWIYGDGTPADDDT